MMFTAIGQGTLNMVLTVDAVTTEDAIRKLNSVVKSSLVLVNGFLVPKHYRDKALNSPLNEVKEFIIFDKSGFELRHHSHPNLLAKLCGVWEPGELDSITSFIVHMCTMSQDDVSVFEKFFLSVVGGNYKPIGGHLVPMARHNGFQALQRLCFEASKDIVTNKIGIRR